MNFKKWVKSIQTAGYNGASTVIDKKKAVIMYDFITSQYFQSQIASISDIKEQLS